MGGTPFLHNAATAPGSTTSIPAAERSVVTPHATLVTTLLAAFLVWLPLQTPVAVVAFQYGGLSVDATRGLLLAKDLFAGVLFVVLLGMTWSRIRLAWYDWLALAYTVLVAIYSVVPYLLGSELPVTAVAASARQFLMPVGIYALGRLAFLAGARVNVLVLTFLAVSVVAALVTVIVYAALPPTFWSSTLDLVTFERQVQGLPNARSLWDIGVLGHYGIGSVAEFGRGIGPFTHPVGAAHYFTVPLLIATAAVFAVRSVDGRVQRLAYVIAAIVFAAAVIVPVSRGAWLAVGLGVLALGLVYRRLPLAVATVVVAGAFIALVPPFSYSVQSALRGTDSSVIAHGNAIEDGLEIVGDNLTGLGLGQADHFGAAFAPGDGDSEAASAAVGENLYLSLLVSVGPLGLIAFVGWMLGIGLAFIPALGFSDGGWRYAGVAAALLGAAAAGMTASSLMRFTTSASFWLLAGLLVGSVLLNSQFGPIEHVRRIYSRR